MTQIMESAPVAAGEPMDTFGLEGRVVAGHLKVHRVVGAGGFGTVYRATHLKLQCPVAVKCLHLSGELGEEDRVRVARSFLEEGRIMYELGRADAAIVRTLEMDVLTTSGGVQVPYLVLEWIEGQPLDELLEEERRRGRPTPIERVLDQLEPIAHALGTAHDAKIAHRDVKPSNIMLTQIFGRETAKLLDFGIAKIVQEGCSSANATVRGVNEMSFGFTPRYAAPEQWIARFGGTGPWTDVFSFALVIIECLTTRPALVGEDAAHWMAACLDPAERPTPRARGVDLGDEVEEVFAKALAVDPRSRYQHARELWSALRAALPGARCAPEGGRIAVPDRTEVQPAAAFAKGGGGTGTVVGGPPLLPGVTSPAPEARNASTVRPKAPRAKGLTLVSGVALAATISFVVVTLVALARSRDPGDGDIAEPVPPPLGPASSAVAAPLVMERVEERIAGEPGSAAGSGFISVFCIPACDLVRIDGAAVGSSPVLDRPATPGLHTIAGIRAGWEAQTTAIVVQPGASVVQRFSMDL